MSNQPNLPDESFRDSISTISEDGKRNYIFPKKPSGPFYDKRKILSYFKQRTSNSKNYGSLRKFRNNI